MLQEITGGGYLFQKLKVFHQDLIRVKSAQGFKRLFFNKQALIPASRKKPVLPGKIPIDPEQ